MASLTFQLNNGVATVTASRTISATDLTLLQNAVKDAALNGSAFTEQDILDFLVQVWVDHTTTFVRGYQMKQLSPASIALT